MSGSTEKKAPVIRPWELPYLGIIHNGGCQNFEIIKTQQKKKFFLFKKDLQKPSFHLPNRPHHGHRKRGVLPAEKKIL